MPIGASPPQRGERNGHEAEARLGDAAISGGIAHFRTNQGESSMRQKRDPSDRWADDDEGKSGAEIINFHVYINGAS